MRNFKFIIITVFYFVISSMCTKTINAQKIEGRLSQTRYVDPKGYFKIIPPAGWQIQEYSQDLRGKVAFISPDDPNIQLRVLVNSTDFNTIEQLIAFCKDVAEKRIGTTTNIEKITFSGKPAVRRTYQFQGLKFHAIDFLVKKADHNLQYGAPPNKYENYLPVIMKSMETYEPVVRDTSDKEATEHFVAKKIRLAQLMIENGDYNLAMEFVKEGLEVSPNDYELLKLKKQIEYKHKTTK